MPNQKKIVQILRIIMPLVAIACAVTLTPWDIVSAWIAPLPGTVQGQLDQATESGLDGIIIYVDRAGAPPAQYTAGWKNRAQHLPATPDALFKIASISKLYVAATTAKLVNRGALSLDDTLAEHLPDLANRIEHADQITLRMMLRHRSGIPNLTDHPDFPWTDPPKTDTEALQYALDLPARFKPDTSYEYSNTNYLLLARILNRISDRTHQDWISELILQPLGLNHTYFSLHDVAPDLIMSGYAVGYGPDIKHNYFGSMLATAQDVGIFLRALNDGSLFTEKEQEIYASIYEYEHTGLLPGYQSIARYHRDIDTVVVQFVNTSGGHAWTLSEITYNRIIKILRRHSYTKCQNLSQ